MSRFSKSAFHRFVEVNVNQHGSTSGKPIDLCGSDGETGYRRWCRFRCYNPDRERNILSLEARLWTV